MQKKIRIFLASSEELKDDRKEIELFINRQNKKLVNKNVFIDLVIWEDFNEAVSQTRKQDDYNTAIRESDILLVLIFSKAGKYTKEEFEVGYEQFKKTSKPIIYVYFKTPKVYPKGSRKEDAISVFEFEERLKELDHFPGEFTAIDNLLFKFNKELDEIIENLCPDTDRQKPDGFPHLLTNIPRHTDEFIGREEDLKDLKKLLGSSEKVVLMNGLGGIGKTTLAKKYVQLHQQDYNHIAWIDVKTQDTGNEFDMTTPEAFAYDVVLSRNLGLSFTKETVVEKFRLICNSLSNTNGKNLLVIDNAKDDLNEQDIKSILPGPPGWHVIVTSRQSFKGFRPFDVQELSPKKAKELFKTYYTKEAEEKDMDDLMQEISYHTLTIELLARTLSFEGQTITIAETVARLKNKQLSSPELQTKIELAHSNKETEIYIHLIQTFDLSLLTDYEKWLMTQFVFLLPRQYDVIELEDLLDITEELEKIKLHTALNSLGKKGWLKNGSYGMHRIIQQMVHYQLQPGFKNIEPLINKFIGFLNFDVGTDFTRLFSIIPYCEFILSQLATDDLNLTKIGELQNNLGIIALNLGEYEKAKNFLEAALSNTYENFGARHPNVGACRLNLATVYGELGDYKKASILLGETLKEDLQNFKENDPNVATTRTNLGVAYKNLGDYKNAEELLELALRSTLENFGEDYPQVATIRSNLGNVYSNLNKLPQAKEMLELALTTNLRTVGEYHLNTATFFNNLASLNEKMNDFKDAEAYFERAIKILVTIVGVDHPRSRQAIENLKKLRERMSNL